MRRDGESHVLARLGTYHQITAARVLGVGLEDSGGVVAGILKEIVPTAYTN